MEILRSTMSAAREHANAGTFSGAPLHTALFIPLVSAARGPIAIRFRIGQPEASVRLEIYDVTGRRIRDLHPGRRGRGEYRTEWDRLDASGGRVARGIYIAKLVAGANVVTQKVVLLGG